MSYCHGGTRKLYEVKFTKCPWISSEILRGKLGKLNFLYGIEIMAQIQPG